MTTQNTTPAAAAPAAPVTPADDFESVFAEITRDESTAKPAAAAAPADAGSGEGASADSAGAAGATEGTAAADPAAAAAAGVAAAGDEPDELAKAQARIAELEAAVAAKEKPAAETPETPETPAAAAAAPADDADDPVKKIAWRQPNEKEAAVLQNFSTEWPEVAEALKVQSQIDIFNAVQYVFAMMQKEYAPKMKQFDQVSEAVGELLTLTDLRSRNNDYDELHDNVVTWTDTLPSFQKKAAKQVLENGTPDEVTELFAEYRKANPTKPALVAGTPAAAPQAPKGKTELTAAAKKAANALSVVDSKRTSATTAVDPNDFDAAWQEANSGS